MLSELPINKMAQNDSEHQDWDMVIHPKTGLFDLQLKEIWHYRDLLMLFVKRDFTAQYKQTILGPLWHVIQPLFTTAMFTVLFDKIAKLPTDNIHPILFFMSGLTMWNYFSACLTMTSNTFVTNASIFGKVYFPRLILPLSVVTSNMLKFGVQFLLLLMFMVYYHFHGHPINISWAWCLIPFLLVLMGGLSLGLGIIISSLTTKYRDFAVLVSFGVQILLYATPIAYPLSFVKDTPVVLFGKLLVYNPLTGIIEAFKYALFRTVPFNLHELMYSIYFTIVIFLIGLVIFNKVEKKFMDTV